MGRNVSRKPDQQQREVASALWVLDPDGCGLGGLDRQAVHYLNSIDQLGAAGFEPSPSDVLVVHDAASAAGHWLQRGCRARIEARTLLWEPISSWARPLVDAAFAHSQSRPQHLLPAAELLEVLTAAQRRDLCIGGTVLVAQGMVVLIRGDLDALTVPLSEFVRTPAGVEPDFGGFEVTDFGQTLRFGHYEAAFDAVLYEHDPDYRRRIKALWRVVEQSLGASIRRLRLQKGLRQEDFGEVPARTVARIENGEVARPHRGTLEVLAGRLGVEVGELGEF